jgi:hypothetical protein
VKTDEQPRRKTNPKTVYPSTPTRYHIRFNYKTPSLIIGFRSENQFKVHDQLKLEDATPSSPVKATNLFGPFDETPAENELRDPLAPMVFTKSSSVPGFSDGVGGGVGKARF